LQFHDAPGNDKIPSKAITEWMGTLKREPGDNPPWTTTLTGQVCDQPVVMSFDTIRQVVNFYSRPVELYVYPPERDF
jgi:hypothetical protein